MMPNSTIKQFNIFKITLFVVCLIALQFVSFNSQAAGSSNQATVTPFTSLYKIPLMAKFPDSPTPKVIDIPFLYHWTSIPSLEKLLDDKEQNPEQRGSNQFPWFKKITEKHFITRYIHKLKDQKGIFTWTNSLGAMGTHETEIYPDLEKPALVRFKMKKNIRALLVTTEANLVDIEKLNNLYDVIIHNHNYYFKEIIITNPDIIESFTADPLVINEDLARDHQVYLDIQNIKNAKSKLNAEETFAISPDLYFNGNGAKFDQYLKPILENYKKTDRHTIPEFYLTH